MKEEQLSTEDYAQAEYIFAPGDRIETLHFVINRFNENKKIIHLWAGEKSQGCHDELWRLFITLMSDMQLCTNKTALREVKRICRLYKKKPNAYVIGNIMLDNIEIDESLVPDEPYDVVLYNPPTVLDKPDIQCEVTEIVNMIRGSTKVFWIEPNGDYGSDLIAPYVTHGNLPHPQFLGLVKNCRRFITNSSCRYFEAPFLNMKGMIVQIGLRNNNRESKHAKMDIPDATEKVIQLLKKLG